MAAPPTCVQHPHAAVVTADGGGVIPGFMAEGCNSTKGKRRGRYSRLIPRKQRRPTGGLVRAKRAFLLGQRGSRSSPNGRVARVQSLDGSTSPRHTSSACVVSLSTSFRRFRMRRTYQPTNQPTNARVGGDVTPICISPARAKNRPLQCFTQVDTAYCAALRYLRAPVSKYATNHRL